MKRTDLEKQLGHKINNRINNAGAASPFGAQNTAVDRKEQRRRDQALGLVPFAVKLNENLVERLHKLGQERNLPMNDLVAELLEKGMEK